mmetsp:Transcript_19019/g.43744  ORF Transcript_19019/g.43744 Transcript_19019/m.43744 type:complete len:239 (+) Transcript_19019:37-753(+)
MSSRVCQQAGENGPLPAATGWPNSKSLCSLAAPRGALAALSRARSEVGHEGVVAPHGRARHADVGLAVHARERRHVARCRACRVEARVLEGGREGVGAADHVVCRNALDGAFAHRFGEHLLAAVVVERAIDRHAVAVEGLPDEPVRRHLGGADVLERVDGDVQPLPPRVLLAAPKVAAGDLDFEIVVAQGDNCFARMLTRESHHDVVDELLNGVGLGDRHKQLALRRKEGHLLERARR